MPIRRFRKMYLARVGSPHDFPHRQIAKLHRVFDGNELAFRAAHPAKLLESEAAAKNEKLDAAAGYQ